MIKIKNYKAQYMFDLFGHLGPKRRKLLDDSWAGIFRANVCHVLPVELLARHYCATNGRPTNELVAIMGAMILQHMHDLTDQDPLFYLSDRHIDFIATHQAVVVGRRIVFY